jgi:hypothetical protein
MQFPGQWRPWTRFPGWPVAFRLAASKRTSGLPRVTGASRSSFPLQLAPSPMMLLAVRIELALDVPVQGPHVADSRPPPMTLLRRK